MEGNRLNANNQTIVRVYKRKKDQAFSESCKRCPHVTYGRTEQAVRSGLSMHNIRKHGAAPIGNNDDQGRIKGPPGSLLYRMQNDPNFDYNEAAYYWSVAIRKKQREEQKAS